MGFESVVCDLFKLSHVYYEAQNVMWRDRGRCQPVLREYTFIIFHCPIGGDEYTVLAPFLLLLLLAF